MTRGHHPGAQVWGHGRGITIDASGSFADAEDAMRVAYGEIVANNDGKFRSYYPDFADKSGLPGEIGSVMACSGCSPGCRSRSGSSCPQQGCVWSGARGRVRSGARPRSGGPRYRSPWPLPAGSLPLPCSWCSPRSSSRWSAARALWLPGPCRGQPARRYRAESRSPINVIRYVYDNHKGSTTTLRAPCTFDYQVTVTTLSQARLPSVKRSTSNPRSKISLVVCSCAGGSRPALA